VAVGGDNRAAPLYIAGNPTQWHGQPLVRPAKSGASFQTATVTSSFCTRLVCFAGGSSNRGDFVATVK
jgi:hypothetical protein